MLSTSSYMLVMVVMTPLCWGSTLLFSKPPHATRGGRFCEQSLFKDVDRRTLSGQETHRHTS